MSCRVATLSLLSFSLNFLLLLPLLTGGAGNGSRMLALSTVIDKMVLFGKLLNIISLFDEKTY